MSESLKFEVESVPHENGSYKIKNGRDLCLEFKFIEDEDDHSTTLYISKIFKCSADRPVSRELIKLIEKLAETISVPPWSSVKYIKMEDGSSIHVCSVDIDLRYLKILTTGESWYNSLGYKSLNHDANVAHNAVIINKPMYWLLSELYNQEDIEEFIAMFPEFSTDWTVQKYVTAMTKEIPTSGTRICTEEQRNKAYLLFNLLYFIGKSEMLEYDFRLQKKVERGTKSGGCAKKTLKNTRIKSRKTTTSKRKMAQNQLKLK